jgi:hypothetical protein
MPERKESEERKKRGAKIGFGTLLRVKAEGVNPGRIDVVLDPGEEDYFSATPIQKKENGDMWLDTTRTYAPRPKQIVETVGEISLDEVIKAILRGYEIVGFKPSEEQIEKLTTGIKEYAQKGRRTIKLG